jgi:hypothetical protein
MFGLTGSEADSMDKIAQDWNAVSLPLSINYRCSKSVIRTAQTMVHEIEAWDGHRRGRS